MICESLLIIQNLGVLDSFMYVSYVLERSVVELIKTAKFLCYAVKIARDVI